ncbi:hypothetical protein P692DRAFT_20739422 [Suillus brevipes Sb2]|nr:hypothetical protein P692DRAFT_20739422 [Suillus brevipes Sb2]
MAKKKDGTDIFFFTYKAETYPCTVVQWFSTFEDLPDHRRYCNWDVTGMPAPTSL